MPISPATLRAKNDTRCWTAAERRWLLIVFATLFVVVAASWYRRPANVIPERMERREDVTGITHADARAIWGPPSRLVVIDDEEVWYYGRGERAGIAFKHGKASQSNLIYYVGPDGTRYATDKTLD